jgi:thioesterase domain-containing protein
VESITGARVPVAKFFAGPTVERIAASLGTESVREASPLVPIRTGGTARPLFFVHAAGGNVLGYADLSRHLGADQPFYGLQSWEVEGGEALRDTVEGMAADYLSAVRAVQPEGPFRLGGWSMGGLVALEMARQAEAVGDEVDLLVLVDPSAPGSPGSLPEAHDDLSLLTAFALHLDLPLERVDLAPEDLLRHEPAERLRRVWEASRGAGVLPPEFDFDCFHRLWAVFHSNVVASREYRVGPCASDVLLVHVEERSTSALADAAQWRALTTGRLQCATVPGNHFNVVKEPHVRALAACISGALSAVAGGGPGERARPHSSVTIAAEG